MISEGPIWTDFLVVGGDLQNLMVEAVGTGSGSRLQSTHNDADEMETNSFGESYCYHFHRGDFVVFSPDLAGQRCETAEVEPEDIAAVAVVRMENEVGRPLHVDFDVGVDGDPSKIREGIGVG